MTDISFHFIVVLEFTLCANVFNDSTVRSVFSFRGLTQYNFGPPSKEAEEEDSLCCCCSIKLLYFRKLLMFFSL